MCACSACRQHRRARSFQNRKGVVFLRARLQTAPDTTTLVAKNIFSSPRNDVSQNTDVKTISTMNHSLAHAWAYWLRVPVCPYYKYAKATSLIRGRVYTLTEETLKVILGVTSTCCKCRVAWKFNSLLQRLASTQMALICHLAILERLYMEAHWRKSLLTYPVAVPTMAYDNIGWDQPRIRAIAQSFLSLHATWIDLDYEGSCCLWWQHGDVYHILPLSLRYPYNLWLLQGKISLHWLWAWLWQPMLPRMSICMPSLQCEHSWLPVILHSG